MTEQPAPIATQDTDAHDKAAREKLLQKSFYVAAGVAGLGAAANSIHHEFYREAKDWPGLKELRAQRKLDWEKVGELEGLHFTDYIKKFDAIEKKYTVDIAEKLKTTRGIESGGWKGWTTGTYQRWRASGPHTRREALFSLATTSIVTLGALFALNQSHQLSTALEAKESKGTSR